MTWLDQLAPHTTRPAGPARAGPPIARAREARTRRSFDAVLASYIRELSAASDATPGPISGPTVDDGVGLTRSTRGLRLGQDA